MKRIELHCHTNMSIDRASLCDVEELIKTAKSMGHKAIAICDADSISAYPAAQRDLEYLDNIGDFKIIYGIQTKADTSPDGAWDICPPHNVTLLAKNDDGIRAIYRLLSTEGTQPGDCDAHTPDCIKQAAAGNILIGTSAITGDVWKALTNGAEDEEILSRLDFYDYVEIAPPAIIKFFSYKPADYSIEEIEAETKRLIELAERKGKPVIATGLTNFVKSEDALTWAAYTGFRGSIDKLPPMHLMTTNEMLRQFDFLGEEKATEIVVKNSNHIADLCTQAYPLGEGKEYLLPHDENLVSKLKDKTYAAAKEIYGGCIPKNVENRLNTELKYIVQYGYGEVLMLAGELAELSVERGFPVFAHGTLGNLFTAYLLGLAKENPLAHDMPWQSCLGWDGDIEPTIDLSVAPEIRSDLIKHLRKLLPNGEVIRCAALSSLGEQEAGRKLGEYLDEHEIVINTKELYEAQALLARKCRKQGIHPNAFAIIPDRKQLYDYTPITKCHLANSGEEEYAAVFDTHSLDRRYYRLHLISNKDMGLIHKLQETTGLKYDDINVYDENLVSAIVAGEAAGVPGFDEEFNRLAKKLRPKNFYELVKIYGFLHGTQIWEGNQEHLLGDRDDALRTALAHRDDVYNFCLGLGIDGIDSFKIMEKVRKGMDISKELNDKLEASGAPPWFMAAIERFIYMFPLSHSANCLHLNLIVLWYKLNRPQEFYQAYFETYAAERERE